ncbi:MAG: aminoglycoside phosphotransferase family protein [Ruminococcaceae bacterium]|nr:aminoglycoside phosphotransferase family protein [Oscillospiraceae bacterium]
MPTEKALSVCSQFDINCKAVSAIPFGNGHINSTFIVTLENGELYVAQNINTYVFKDPEQLMDNVFGVTNFVAESLKKCGEDVSRGTLHFIKTKEGKKFYVDPDGNAWRMYRYVDKATAYDSAEKEGLLFEAAYTFGKFQRQLGDYPAETLYETIPDFHNTVARYKAFEDAVALDAAGRAELVSEDIAVLRKYADRASVITSALDSGTIPIRVTHNDTKLNNVLIDDASGKGVCVIDLDTVMPGSLLYDFGDSIRFAANNGTEDDKDLSNVWLNLDLFKEFADGFLLGIGEAITEAEKELLPVSVFVLTYELALRFMTDYLNGDVYFKTKYPEHNIFRTRVQIRLMQDIDKKLDEMKHIIDSL